MNNSLDADKLKIFKEDDVRKYLPEIEIIDENEDFRDELSDNSKEVFTVSYDGTVIGLAYIDDDTEGFIYIYIFPEYRNKGYGFLAAVKAEEQIKTSPLKSIMTGYDAKDKVAAKLAQKLGYGKKFASAVMKYRGPKFEEKALPVRKFKPEDFDETYAFVDEAFHLMRLGTGCFPDSALTEPDSETRKAWTEAADKRFVYVLGDEIVAQAKTDGNTLAVLAVKPSYQGEGIGRELLKFAINRILENGNDCVKLWCVVGNNKARRLYESLGFEETGRANYDEKKFEGKITE